MSQWNNTFGYNNQHQSIGWNGDMNSQFMNQSYYSNRDPNTQYVTFNEFLTQMHNNGQIPRNVSNYGNIQYQNYPGNQQAYQGMPSAPQNQPHYISNATVEREPHSAQTSTEDSFYRSEIVRRSNLTPTATEFVPKHSIPSQTVSAQSMSLPENSDADSGLAEPSTSYRNIKSKSSERNWRERPQPQQLDGKNKFRHRSERESQNRNSYYQDSRNWEENNHDSNSQSSQWDSNNYKEDASTSSQQEFKSYNQDSNNSHNNSGSSQFHNSNENKSKDRHKNNNQQRNRDSSHWDAEGLESNGSQLLNHEKIPTKSNSKAKNKDAERTFYNSSINKSHDARNGKGDQSGRRNWSGSSRFRGVERNITEEEQYAKNYQTYRDDKTKAEYTPNKPKSQVKPKPDKEVLNNDLTQRDRLSEQLDKGSLECLVCCERVKQIESVWSCGNCYHVLHLRCIKKWAMTSLVAENKWRCPACQNTSDVVPREYRCLCGAVRSPEYQRGYVIAHTCGKSCKRPRSCPHPCTLLCHPGPCPPCQATVVKECGCGKEKRSVLCSSKLAQVCGQICERTLECGVHKCTKECHEGPCEDCTETVTQVCHCPLGKSRSVECTKVTSTCAAWSCGAECSRVLECGAHVCARACHAPPCDRCAMLPEAVLTCPCGKTRLAKGERKSCTDPIPLCESICAKPLQCGPAGDRHFCKKECHSGMCPPCPEKTVMPCRCGHSSREVPCVDIPEILNNVECQKKCNKKLSCGRHRCRATCCVATSHRCAVVCGRMLSCQLHRCQEFCHTGHCAPCSTLSFEEVRCACGAQALLPPVRCGARAPACSAPCRRTRACAHSPHHNCHAGDCPPCVVLTTKRCYGGHEERKTIPCSQKEFSCGLPCGKPLPCGKHTCIKTCHKGPCDTAKCTQPCNEKRPSCGHPCAAPCHSSEAAESSTVSNAGPSSRSNCPSSAPCRRMVRATCQCGRRHAERPCFENSRDYSKMMSALAATKIQEGGSMDLSEVQRPSAMLKTLECDDECRAEARSRALALALQIRNPDVSSKLAPRYSDHVRALAGREPAFAQTVHERLTDLVQLAKKSKQKTRSHSFPSMNRQKRQFIHELCEHFGCESVAYDAEPNRNVVATADKEKSWLPAMSVLEVLSREAGKRRVPGPVVRPATAAPPKCSSGWATLTSTNAWAARSQPKPTPTPTPAPTPTPTPEAPKIDYFDNPPDN